MTPVSATDRFELFNKLYRLATAASAFTCLNVNIVDATLSPLYLTLISLNSRKQTSDTSPFSLLLSRFKEKMNAIRYKKKISSCIEESKGRYQEAPYLFFPVEPTHLHQMIPVLHQFRKKGVEFLVVTNRLAIYNKLIADGFPPVLIAYPGYQEQRTIKTLFGQSGEENLKKLIEEYIDLAFAQEYSRHVCEILDHYTFPLIHQLSEVLSLVKPSAIVVGYDITLEGRILTRLARQMNIRSLCIQHGSISGEPLDHHHIVDQFLVYGNAVKKYLVDHGMSPSNCIVTGAPYLDEWKNDNAQKTRELKAALNIADDAPMILIALSGPGHSTSLKHFNMIVLQMLKLTVEYPDYHFVAKLHRKDKLSNYKNLVAMVPQHRLTIVEDGRLSFSIFDWLKSCNLLITGTSTVAQEAMLLDVPVMTIDLMNEFHDVDFIDQDCTVHITDGNKLGAAIHTLVTDRDAYTGVKENARRYAEDFFYKLDHNAATRCMELITTQESSVHLVS